MHEHDAGEAFLLRFRHNKEILVQWRREREAAQQARDAAAAQ